MSNLFLILVIAFVIIVFAIALLAIGWLITGKTRIEKHPAAIRQKRKMKAAIHPMSALLRCLQNQYRMNNNPSFEKSCDHAGNSACRRHD